MKYRIALVEDRGAYWEVTNVIHSTMEALADQQESMLKLSNVAADMISEAITNGKTVHVNKTLVASEVIPADFSIIDPADADPLISTRKAAIVHLRMLVTPELAKIAGLTLYGFMVLNNEFINDGYVITSKNREDQYLAILETGDEELISKLEQYLNYKDEIERVSHLERKFAKVIAEINDAKLEEIAGIKDKFLEDFYSRF